MRPPMQSAAALQQNEAQHRPHPHSYAQQAHQQQQQQQLLRQQQTQVHNLQQQHPLHQSYYEQQPPQLQPVHITGIDTLQPQQSSQQQHHQHQQARKFSLQHHEFAIEKHLNFVTGTTIPTANAATAAACNFPSRNSAPPQPLHHQTYQPQFARPSVASQHHHHQIVGNSLLVDTSDDFLPPPPVPPHVPPLSHTAVASPVAANTFRRAANAHRSSVISQYSRSSSSEDGSISGSYPRASQFDDAAENFIIHFPADSPLHNQQHEGGINLPLSETEPLLNTNGEVNNVANAQRGAIRLSKNSASLIFTRKDVTPHKIAALPRYYLPATTNTASTTATAASNNNCSGAKQQRAAKQQQQQQQHKRQPQKHPQLQHSLSLRTTTDYNRKQAKHLPASYQQHEQLQFQRRSLQLNYNNNLVTTASCSANNNYCCPSIGGSSNNVGAVLHGKHLHHHQQQQQQQPQLNAAPNTTATSAASGTGNSNVHSNTAAAARKQHAYSWYAPVYSALEEELEQDSRDSSPIHNLANTKKQHSTHYQHRSSHNSTSAADNDTVALLETRNQINIQAQLHAQANQTANGRDSGRPQSQARRNHAAAQAPNSLPLPQAHNASFSIGVGSGSGNTNRSSIDCNGVLPLNSYEVDGQPPSSLSLPGTQLPPRRRFGNFLKSLVGLKSTSSARNSSSKDNGSIAEHSAAPLPSANSAALLQPPGSPEITITRTPSEQNLVVMRDPAGRGNRQQLLSGGDKLTNGSTTSLNVVQQKLWNIMRRNGSATSLHQEKSHSIVQYKGMRKCETVLALTRQTQSLCSPMFAGHTCAPGEMGASSGHVVCGMRRTHTTGSGIFNAQGVEQIRPLNRLRTSVTSMNATCSRCSSLLSLAASGSRYSLNTAANGGFVHAQLPTSVSQQQLQGMHALDCKPPPHSSQQHQQQHQQQRKISNVSNSHVSSSTISNANRVREDVSGTTPAPPAGNSGSGNASRKSSAGANSAHSTSSNSPPSNNTTTATLNSSGTSTTTPASTPTTPTPTPSAIPTVTHHHQHSNADNATILVDVPPLVMATNNALSSMSATVATTTTSTTSPAHTTAGLRISQAYPYTITSLLATPAGNEVAHDTTDGRKEAAPSVDGRSGGAALKTTSTTLSAKEQKSTQTPTPFQSFTCKLCLVDVETASEATTLQQCGCQFCTECMKAYVDFEITEGAYEISCPDAQCQAQGVMTLNEIANLTTANLMKKHHRYRLNKEIEMDKTRTWCPRAGCETVCSVGPHSDATPSTSSGHGNAGSLLTPANEGGLQLLCAVQCPSCKDEFCSACKKAWHPNISCEEHSRRLVADGQDDIGIPFDNDLIKSCPMCHVPIEKDEGCAQMMCKRCKHVFCWYCLASLDDDFLLRHYDRGPCKNKLGHSRASVVWHRAQVIGIFAGFGILLLVASPLLLLAAPCIICCKCRSCSGSKIEEGDVDMDEGTALHST